jgi:hypothetical protein
MEDEAKPWWASKTVWAGIVGGAATLAGVFGVTVLDAETQAQIVAALVSIATIALRFVTTGPIK